MVNDFSGLIIEYNDNGIEIREWEILNRVRQEGSVRLTLSFHLTEQTKIVWETVMWRNVLYVQVPTGLLPGGSKEGFIGLLEYAEEILRCSHVVVCMKKDRVDRPLLVRTFMFLGFTVMAPGHVFIPPNSDTNTLFMLYKIE